VVYQDDQRVDIIVDRVGQLGERGEYWMGRCNTHFLQE
jgi:hypothetical protein